MLGVLLFWVFDCLVFVIVGFGFDVGAFVAFVIDVLEVCLFDALLR